MSTGNAVWLDLAFSIIALVLTFIYFFGWAIIEIWILRPSYVYITKFEKILQQSNYKYGETIYDMSDKEYDGKLSQDTMDNRTSNGIYSALRSHIHNGIKMEKNKEYYNTMKKKELNEIF